MQYCRCSDTLWPETYGWSAGSSLKPGSPSRLAVVCSMIHTQNGSLCTLVPSRSISTALTGRRRVTGCSG